MWIRGTFVGLAGILIGTAGCDSLLGLISLNTVTVMLVNTTGFSVDATIQISDREDIGLILPNEWDELEETIPPGATRSFTRNCEDLQAIFIEDADLRLIGGLGPEADTRVYLDGEDFSCGDVIVFTFTYEDLDFDVDVNYQ